MTRRNPNSINLRHVPNNRERPSRGTVAYLVSQYPWLSHTFVLREVRALRAAGFEVVTFSIHKTDFRLSRVDMEESSTTINVLPTTIVRLVRAHSRALKYSMSGYLKTLQGALRYGQRRPRYVLWQIFYFAEAMVVWEECESRAVRHIHSHFANVSSDVARLVRAFGRFSGQTDFKWSFTMHGPAEFFDPTHFGLRQKVLDADLVLCISDFCRAQLMAISPSAEAAKMHVVHCGVDPGELLFVERVSPVPRELRILSVGRLAPVKGFIFLIDAVKLLRARGVNVEVQIVGDGPERDRLERRAAAAGVADQVRLRGAVGQDDLRRFWEWADLFVSSSLMEGVPVVLMEAMAEGIPVVATRVAGVPELVEDGISGRLVPPARADMLAESVCELYSDWGQAQSYARAARQKIEADFNSSEIALDIARLFDNLHHGTARPEVPPRGAAGGRVSC